MTFKKRIITAAIGTGLLISVSGCGGGSSGGDEGSVLTDPTLFVFTVDTGTDGRSSDTEFTVLGGGFDTSMTVSLIGASTYDLGSVDCPGVFKALADTPPTDSENTAKVRAATRATRMRTLRF